MVNHKPPALFKQLYGRILREVVEQEKSLCVEQFQHHGYHPRKDHGEGIGEHEAQHFIRVHDVCHDHAAQDEQRQGGHVADDRDPSLYHDGFVRAKLKAIKQVAHGNRASADDFQIKITASRCEKPCQDGD